MEINEIKFTLRATLPATPGSGGYYNFELIELSATYGDDEEPADVLAHLNTMCRNAITWKAGNPEKDTDPPVRAVQLNTSPQQNAPQGSSGAGGKTFKPFDTSKAYHCKWDLPFQAPNLDMAGVRALLKQGGARFNPKKEGGDNCWYTERPIPGTEHLDQWKISLSNCLTEGDKPPF